jgi:hypothetical protein
VEHLHFARRDYLHNVQEEPLQQRPADEIGMSSTTVLQMNRITVRHKIKGKMQVSLLVFNITAMQ